MTDNLTGDIKVSTHAPLAGSDEVADFIAIESAMFQPTLPLRGATRDEALAVCMVVFQPTLPLRGATVYAAVLDWVCGVSTHAPLAGSDPHFGHLSFASAAFQPTLPLRGATATSC